MDTKEKALTPGQLHRVRSHYREQIFRYLRYSKDKEVAHLERVPAELLYGDEHLDVVAAEAGVDPAGHGELEAAEAAHEEVTTVPAHTPVTWPP